MFDFALTRIFPPALLAGLGLYGLVTLIWLQPLVEVRMAKLTLIPACERALETAQNTASAPIDPRRGELEMLIKMLEQSGLNQIPMIGTTLDEAKRQLRAMKPKRMRVSGIERTSICSCAVDKAFEAAGFKMTMHVATARSYTPAPVRSLPQTTIAHALSGQCGTLPWKKG